MMHPANWIAPTAPAGRPRKSEIAKVEYDALSFN
jgi:hypothetical protein